jgi:hypothetical protein
LSRSGGNDSSPVAAISEDTEFFPAVELSCLGPEPGTLDARLSALEQTVKKSGNGVSPRHSGPRAMDTTGVIAGAILVGAGLLLYTGNTEIIKNPILSLACGSFLIVLSLLGRNWYNAKLTKTVE